MKIGIDARLYFQTGVGVYLRNFISNLSKVDTKYHYYLYILKRDLPKIDPLPNNFTIRPVEYAWHSLSEQLGFFYTLNRDALDLMHFTYFSYPIMHNKAFIATIHDVTPLLFKTGRASTKNMFVYELKYRFFRIVIKTQIQNSKIVITPTQSVRDQIVEIFGKDKDKKIKPIYEGVDADLKSKQPNMQLKEQFAFPFYLYVGNFYPHKNVERLVKSFSRIRSEKKLVLVGPENYFSDRLKRVIISNNAESRIIFYPNASTEDLIFFYQYALALVNPSLSEGFGLPLVEALYFRLPVIASDIPVFRELLGNSYQYFNPIDESSIESALRDFNPAIQEVDYDSLMKKFSFYRMTQEIVQLYNTILKVR